MINPTDAVNRETGNQAESAPRELSAEELRFTPKIEQHFSSTRELAGAKDFVGQERALASLELGLGVAGNGYRKSTLSPVRPQMPKERSPHRL